jgi:hypothetical protein
MLDLRPVQVAQLLLAVSVSVWFSWMFYWCWNKACSYTPGRPSIPTYHALLATEKVMLLIQVVVTSVAVGIQMEVVQFASDVKYEFRLASVGVVALALAVSAFCTIWSAKMWYVAGAVYAVWQVYIEAGLLLAILCTLGVVLLLIGLNRISCVLLQWSVLCSILCTTAVMISINLMYVHVRDPRVLNIWELILIAIGAVLITTTHVLLVYLQRPTLMSNIYTQV